jgi:hypothetical protein
MLVGLTALALAATAFAGENTGKILESKFSGPGDAQPFEAAASDAAGNPLVDLKCSEVSQGTKDVKFYWLDPEHMPDADAKFYYTWGDNVEEILVGKNCIGLAQLRDFYPDGKATFTMRIVFVGQVANRVKLGNIKPEYIIPVANSPGFWGSVINEKGLKGKREGGLPGPKYLDLTEYGAKVEVDAKNYEATFTWTYEPAGGFLITDGQLDIGLIQYQK